MDAILQRYIDLLRLEHRPEDSINCAMYAVRQWLDFAQGGSGRELLLRHLDRWKNPRTRITNLRHVRSFVRWQAAEGLVPEDWARAVRMKPRAAARHKVLTPEEIQALIGACGEDWMGRRNACLITLLSQTGCRRDEIRRLKVADVDLDRREFKTRIKGGDTIYVHLTSDAAEALDKWIPHTVNDYLFTGRGRKKVAPLSRKRVQTVLDQAAAAAGLKIHIHPHVFRHTVGQRVYDATGRLDVTQKVLHHKSMATTLIYAKLSDREASQAMDEALSSHPSHKKKAA